MKTKEEFIEAIERAVNIRIEAGGEFIAGAYGLEAKDGKWVAIEEFFERRNDFTTYLMPCLCPIACLLVGDATDKTDGTFMDDLDAAKMLDVPLQWIAEFTHQFDGPWQFDDGPLDTDAGPISRAANKLVKEIDNKDLLKIKGS
jgi:hypothetical protein